MFVDLGRTDLHTLSNMSVMQAVRDGYNGDARELKVCADPNNLPFSNAKGEGFENKIATLIAAELSAELNYYWWAQRRGFVPVEALGGHQAIAKFDHRDAVDLDDLAGRFDAGKKPVHCSFSFPLNHISSAGFRTNVSRETFFKKMEQNRVFISPRYNSPHVSRETSAVMFHVKHQKSGIHRAAT
jgi:hypothetical protein